MGRAPMVVAPLSILLAGCSGSAWGNLSVLVITCGIFLGTLSLGRRVHHPTPDSTPPSAASDDGGKV